MRVSGFIVAAVVGLTITVYSCKTEQDPFLVESARSALTIGTGMPSVPSGGGYCCADRVGCCSLGESSGQCCTPDDGNKKCCLAEPAEAPPSGSGSEAKSRALSASPNSSCVAKDDGSVWCWGWRNGSPTAAVIPAYDGIAAKATSVAIEHNLSCVVEDSGAVRCWGVNQFGTLGNGEVDVRHNNPVDVVGIDGVSASAAQLDVGGGYKSQICALLTNGGVRCWGYGGNGALGNGLVQDSAVPVDVVGIDGVSASAIDVSVGEKHACAVLDSGAVHCWGANSSGQLGTGDTMDQGVPASVAQLDGVSASATRVAAGSEHTCAILDSGAVKCWGLGTSRQLGNDPEGADPASQLTPVDVIGLDGLTPGTSAVAIAAYNQSCAILETGATACWGKNAKGHLGRVNNVDGAVPVVVTGLDGSNAHSTAVGVSVSRDHSCVLQKSGGARCWGGAALGNGPMNRTGSSFPLSVAGPDGLTPDTTALQVFSSLSSSCVTLESGRVDCWGSNSNGVLGIGANLGGFGADQPIPAQPAGADGSDPVVKFSNGYYVGCILHESGTLRCMGWNKHGQLGDLVPLNGTQGTPLEILPTHQFADVALNDWDACGVLANGSVECWGRGNQTPAGLVGLDGSSPSASAVSVSAGRAHLCAILESGGVKCWGTNSSGELGTGVATGSQSDPVDATLLAQEAVVSLELGAGSSCALLSSGAVKCWGENQYGQLGNGTNAGSLAPVTVVGVDGTTPGSSAVDLSVGRGYVVGGSACVVLETGAAKCWGRNEAGQLGNPISDVSGKPVHSAVPVDVMSLDGSSPATSAISVTAASAHGCAVLATGAVKCWGKDLQGELGDDRRWSFGFNSLPVDVVGL